MSWKWTFRKKAHITSKEEKFQLLKNLKEKEFQECQLKDICYFARGNYSSSEDKSKEHYDFVVRSSDIKDGRIIKNIVGLEWEEKRRFPDYWQTIKRGDLIISTKGPPDRIAIHWEGPELPFKNSIIKIEPIDQQSVNIQYLYHWLMFSEEYSKTFVKKDRDWQIDLEKLKKLRVCLPSLKTQNLVAEKLNSFLFLELSLDKEKEQRRQQYKYIRKYLLEQMITN